MKVVANKSFSSVSEGNVDPEQTITVTDGRGEELIGMGVCRKQGDPKPSADNAKSAEKAVTSAPKKAAKKAKAKT